MREGRTVAVVVVTHNSADVVPGFLDTLTAAMTSIAAWRLVLVDNASSDATLAVAEAHPLPKQVIALDTNGGYAAGLNAGVRAVPGDAYLFMNPDVRLGAGSALRLLDALDESLVGIAVPRLFDAEGQLCWSLRRDPTVARAFGEAVLGGARAGKSARWGEVVRTPETYATASTVDWASGAVMMVDAQCLDEVGDWDESFFLYSEETDFCLRAREAGWRVVYRPEAEALHIGGESRVSPFLRSVLAVNRVELYRRRHGRTRTAAFRLAVVTNEALRAVHQRASRAALLALLLPSRRLEAS